MNNEKEYYDVELNYTFDKPTTNGHIYPKKDLLKQLDRYKNEEIGFVVGLEHDVCRVKFSDLVGILQDYTIDENDVINLKMKKMNNPKFLDENGLEDIINNSICTTSMIGELDEDGKTVKNITLIKFAFVEKR